MSWMSVNQAAKELGVADRQVRNLIASDVLSAERFGRSWKVSAASVHARRRQHAAPGRPLSADSAWRLLARVDAVIRADATPVQPPLDRRDRHRLRRLLAELAEPEQWSSWLRRRGDHRRVWFHPAARRRIEADQRVEHPDLSALLGIAVGDLGPLYVEQASFGTFVEAHHGHEVADADIDDAADVMVVPSIADDVDWRAHVAAAALVDLSVDSDARVRHAALELLRSAAGQLERDSRADEPTT